MTVKPVIPRDRADQDIAEAIDFYLSQAGAERAIRFIDALERAYRHIARNPASGSPPYAHELDLPGLRSWPLKRFPHLVFYAEREDHNDVWRVLHAERNIPAWMGEPSDRG